MPTLQVPMSMGTQCNCSLSGPKGPVLQREVTADSLRQEGHALQCLSQIPLRAHLDPLKLVVLPAAAPSCCRCVIGRALHLALLEATTPQTPLRVGVGIMASDPLMSGARASACGVFHSPELSGVGEVSGGS